MKITGEALEQVRRHGAEGYPNEICGVLAGPKGKNVITTARPARNIISDRSRDRYEIDPLDHIRIQRECDSSGLEIVGYYHSHPDHPAQASIFDAERAWAGPVYVIVSVNRGQPSEANAFIARQDGGPFRSETLELV